MTECKHARITYDCDGELCLICGKEIIYGLDDSDRL